MGKRDFCLQVRMNISTDVELPQWRCPTHCRLRRVEMGDEMRLSELLVSIGVGWTKLDVPRMSQYIKEPDRWDGSHVIEYQGRLVALCIATRRGEFDPVWGNLTMFACTLGIGGVGWGWVFAPRAFNIKDRVDTWPPR